MKNAILEHGTIAMYYKRCKCGRCLMAGSEARAKKQKEKMRQALVKQPVIAQ